LLAVSVTLYEVTSTRARAGSDYCAFLPADQRSTYRSGNSTDNSALSLAVMMSIGTPVSQTIHGSGQYDKGKH